MRDRTAMLEALERLIDQFKADGLAIDPAGIASRLSSYYPNSGLETEQIARELQRRAAMKGARVEKPLPASPRRNKGPM